MVAGELDLEMQNPSRRWGWRHLLIAFIVAFEIALVVTAVYRGFFRQPSEVTLATPNAEVDSTGVEGITNIPDDYAGRQPRTASTPRGKASHASYPVYFGTDRSPALPFSGASLTNVLLALCAIALCIIGVGFLLSAAKRGWRRLTGVASLLASAAMLFGVLRAYLPLPVPFISEVFGSGRAELQHGICLVSIPYDHTRGQLEGPDLMRFDLWEDPDKHIVLKHVRILSPNDFRHELEQRAETDAWREALVFIHGYNTSFEDASRRTAQLAHDLRYGGIAAFFSWPSAAGSADYTRDSQNAAYAVPHLRQFVQTLARDGKLNRIQLVAHSMGNQCLAAALQADFALGDCKLDECILAAPDIDAQIFQRDLARSLIDQVGRLTLYASSGDRALAASKIPNGYQRLGDVNPMTVIPRMESIDASRIKTDSLGHSTFASSPELIEDLRQMIEDDLAAEHRKGMRPVEVGATLKYWEFVPDDRGK